MKNVAVLIPAHNEEKYIKNTLLSLKNQTIKPVAIVVVNDGSTDRTADIVTEFKYGYKDFLVQLINLDRSTGYGRGIARNLNTGKKWLDKNSIPYKFLMILDADQILSENYIELCMSEFDPDTAIVAGTPGRDIIQPHGAHRIYAKWYVDKYPFPLVTGYDSLYFYQALEHNYKVKIVRDAIAYGNRTPRGSYNDDFDRGIYSYRLGYPFPFILARSLKNMIVFRRLKTILMVYGFLFSFIMRKKRYSTYKKISLYQKMRIKQMITRSSS